MATRETLNSIMTMGHSRVPVYSGNPTNIIGLILVKNLLAVYPEEAVPLRKMVIRKIPRVSEDMPLYDILNEFQKGHSHLAVVYKDLNAKTDTSSRTSDSGKSKRGRKKMRSHARTSKKRDDKKAGSTVNTQSHGIQLESDAVPKSDGGQQAKKSPPATPSFKKRQCPDFRISTQRRGCWCNNHRGCHRRASSGREILNETDEYVNIHNRIKVNMHASHEKAPNSSSHETVLSPNVSFNQTAISQQSTLSTYSSTPNLSISPASSTNFPRRIVEGSMTFIKLESVVLDSVVS